MNDTQAERDAEWRAIVRRSKRSFRFQFGLMVLSSLALVLTSPWVDSRNAAIGACFATLALIAYFENRKWLNDPTDQL